MIELLTSQEVKPREAPETYRRNPSRCVQETESLAGRYSSHFCHKGFFRPLCDLANHRCGFLRLFCPCRGFRPSPRPLCLHGLSVAGAEREPEPSSRLATGHCVGCIAHLAANRNLPPATALRPVIRSGI